MFLTSRCHQHFWPCLMFLATANTFCAPYSESFSCNKLVVPGFESRQEQGSFFFPKRPSDYGAPPNLLLFIRNWCSFPGVKQHGRDVDHSPLTPEVKSEWTYTCTPPISPCGEDGVSFSFTSLGERICDVLPLAAGFADEWRKCDINAAVKLLTFLYIFAVQQNSTYSDAGYPDRLGTSNTFIENIQK